MKFEYLEAASVDEAVKLLSRYSGRAKVIAGGTDLLVQMRRRVSKPEYVIGIGKIKELNYISYGNKGLKIGPLATISSLAKSEEVRRRCSVISQAAGQMASVGVRNTGTVGGNLCNASPSADTAPGLIALSATVKIAGPKKKREIPLEEFFTGPGATVLGKDEMMTEITVPVAAPRTGSAYLKHGMRGTIDLAMVGVAAMITLKKDKDIVKDARIVLGAVAPTPIRARRAEALLKDKELTDDLIDEAGRVAADEAKPITDIRATAEYRSEMVALFTRRALKEALSKAKSG